MDVKKTGFDRSYHGLRRSQIETDTFTSFEDTLEATGTEESEHIGFLNNSSCLCMFVRSTYPWSS